MSVHLHGSTRTPDLGPLRRETSEWEHTMSAQQRVALVTGGASGIGAAIAHRLLGAGYSVVVADVRPPAPGGPAMYVECDVRDEGQVSAAVATAVAAGRLDVLVNCAGITGKTPIDEMELDSWQRILDINLTGTMLMIKHAVPALERSGVGSIVNIASLAASRTLSRYNTAYAASKGAVEAFTRALVYELSERGVRVNAVAPGLVDTPILTAHDDAWRSSRTASVPMGRFCGPDEIAAAAVFLASNEASYITGQVVTVDGGISAVHYARTGA
jgi:NAD(P)-dependent dehydrogenase (short-subunit alcohol dehydrogenase family)